MRILSLEDDPNDTELIQGLLETEGIVCEVPRVDTEPAFLAALEQGEIDLILADYTLPSFDGLSALKLAMSSRPDVPFIFVSGTLGEEVAIEALKIGATDYVLKTRLSQAGAVGAPRAAGSRRESRTQAGRGGAAAERDLPGRSAAAEPHRQLRLGCAERRNLLVRETFRIFECDPATRPSRP